MVRTLLIDNYDSFTYNLVDLVTAVNGLPPVVVTNDVAWESIDFSAFDNVVISPGPGHPGVPRDFGIAARVITESGLPVLGVCLGHQGVCAAFGARVVHAPEPMHGRVSAVHHDGEGLFAGVPSPVLMTRYHSLMVVGLPAELQTLATTDDGVVMAVRHRDRPLWGVQFHPESIASEHGLAILKNFRDLSLAGVARTPTAPEQVAPEGADATGRFVLEHVTIGHEPDPARLYERLFADRPGAFWLDGTARRDAGARVTIMGDCTGPDAEYLTYDVTTRSVRIDRGLDSWTHRVSSLFDFLEKSLRDRAIVPDPALPVDFHLGYVGYLGYELKAETGGQLVHRSPHPDAALVFADRAVVIDHDRGRTYLLTLRAPHGADAHRSWLDNTAAAVADVGACAPFERHAPLMTATEHVPPRLRHDAAAYRARIEASMDLIRDGQTYEVCLTNCATVDGPVDAVDVFDRVRALNPVPYAALLQFDGLSVISASPERFVRVRPDRTVDSAPIKGTRPRGRNGSEDELLRHALRSSEKERAENLMIVDLVRNELARVCEPGSVHVPELFAIESYVSVHQLVSTVAGTLRRDTHPVAAVRALFPAGSMTGAPKLRTMEILDHLEAGPRGVYSGALGYLSLSGAVDLSVVIRTMVATDSGVEFGVGGAITALSDPAEEYAEILVKATSSQRVLSEPVLSESVTADARSVPVAG